MRNAAKTEELLNNLPSNLSFTQKRDDPLYVITDVHGRNFQDFRKETKEKTDNLFIDTVDPAYPCKVYYVEKKLLSTDVITGDTKIVDNLNDFLSNDVTGLDKISEHPLASGVFPSGIIGLSYGFDWDDPALYVTSGNNFIDVVSNISPSGVFPSGILPSGVFPADENVVTHFDYTIVKQDYDNTGADEYLSIQTEVLPVLKDGDQVYFTYVENGVETGEYIFNGDSTVDPLYDCLFFDGNYYYVKEADYDGGQWHLFFYSEFPNLSFLTEFLLMGDRKVAYLQNDPVQDLVIIDVGNLRNPNDPDSAGIVVSSDDYTVGDELNNNKIIFDKSRSDYIPASGTIDSDIVYPVDYQPDMAFGSSYIVEYFHRVENKPKYLTQKQYMRDLGIKGIPLASIDI